MENKRKNSGITLIVLVITIIVLLILAGVSISIVVMQNGIMDRTIDSKEKTNKAYAEERVYVEVLGSHDKSGKINLDDLNKNLRENLENVELKANDGSYAALTESNRINKLPSTVKYRGYDVEIVEDYTEEESAKLKKPDGDDKTLEIGQVVIDDKPLAKGWKYFYQDEDNYYFIYEDFFDGDAIPNPGKTLGGNIERRETYSLWSMYSRDQERQDDLVNYLLGAENYSGIWDPITEVVKEILRKKGLPEEEINKISTTGSPTKEQFAEAYNERYSETGKLLVSGAKSSWDYNFDNATRTNNEDNLDLTSKEVYNNDLFFPHHGKYEGCPGYWLASASRVEWYVCCVDCMNGGLDTNQGALFTGIRPLIKIPKSLFE